MFSLIYTFLQQTSRRNTVTQKKGQNALYAKKISTVLEIFLKEKKKRN